MRLLALAIGFLLGSSSVAHAEPISAAIGLTALIAGTGASAAAAAAIGGFIVSSIATVGITFGLSMLNKATAKKPEAGQALTGLETSVQVGGDIARQIPVGRTAVKGHLVYHNTAGPNNEYYQQVRVLADWPCDSLDGLMIDGKPVTLVPAGGDPPGRRAYTVAEHPGIVRINFWDGTQNVADGDVIFHSNPVGKWDITARLTGLCYVSMLYIYQTGSKLYDNGIPDPTFILKGAKLYDLRFDSTNGGSGPQRWSDPSSWTYSENPAIACYNFQRGFYAPNGELILGMGTPVYDLLQDTYISGANICDETVTLATGGTEKRYRIATILSADQDVPFAQSLEVILSTCAGYLYDYGGFYYFQAGAGYIASATITDADLVSSVPVSFSAKRSRADLINRFHGQFLATGSDFQPLSYTPQVSASGVSADGEELGRALDLLSVPSQSQAERIAQVRLRENRRQATAAISLGFNYLYLQAGDWITWNSDRYGNATWRIQSRELNPETQTIQLGLAQIDSNVYSWSTADQGGTVAPAIRLTGAALASTVSGFFVTSGVRTSVDGLSSYPTLVGHWNLITDPSITAVIIEYRVIGSTAATRVSDPTPGDGQLVIDGVTPGTNYEARATIETDPARITTWTGWVSQLTNDASVFATALADAIVTFAALEEDLAQGFNLIDATPTADPTLTNANLTSSIIKQPDGTIRTKLVLNWPDVTSTNLDSYEVEVWEGATGSHVPSMVRASYDERWDLTPGVVVSARIRSVSKMGVLSNWSAVATHTMASNTVAPANASGLVAVGRFSAIDLSWAVAPESDYSYTEVWMSLTAVFAAGSSVAAIRGHRWVLPLPPGSTRWFWIRNVNTSGLASPSWHPLSTGPGAVATTQQIVTADIAATAIDQTKFAAGLQPVAVIANSGVGHTTGVDVAVNAADNKLYRWNAALGWVKSVDGGDLVANSILTGSISAGAVKTTQLDAKAVTASKLAVGSKNVAYNADVSIGTRGYRFDNNAVGGGTVDFGISSFWAPTGATPVYIHAAGFPSGGSLNIINWPILQNGTTSFYQVAAGAYYQASACLSMHRCSGTIIIGWVNSSGITIGAVAGNTVLNPQGAAQVAIRDFPKSSVIAQAPPGATQAYLVLQAHAFTAADPYLFGSCIMFAGASSDQTEVDPYVDPGITIIDGGNVRTQSIVTDHMVAGSIHGDIITAGTLGAEAIEAGSVLSGTVTVSGTPLGTAVAAANNPAAAINLGFTRVDPGRILIAGSTLLSDWRQGADITKIAGGQIYTQSITTTQLAANSVTTDRLAANAVTASKIFVTDFSNVVPQGDFEEAAVGNGAGWIYVGAGPFLGMIENFGIAITGTKCLRLDKGANFNASFFIVAVSQPVSPIKGGRVYELAGYANPGAVTAAGFYLRVNWYNSASAYIGFNDAASNAALPGGWQRFAGKFTAPANASYANIEIYNYVTSTSQYIYVDAVSLKIASGGTLIEDDTIDTGHIRATSITAGKLSTGEVVTLSAQIRDAVIINAKIGNLEVQTLKIANNAVTNQFGATYFSLPAFGGIFDLPLSLRAPVGGGSQATKCLITLTVNNIQSSSSSSGAITRAFKNHVVYRSRDGAGILSAWVIDNMDQVTAGPVYYTHPGEVSSQIVTTLIDNNDAFIRYINQTAGTVDVTMTVTEIAK